MATLAKGFAFLELLVVLALVAILILAAVPDLRGMEKRRDFENFARETFELLEKCRWKAVNERAYSGAWFQQSNGTYFVSLYLDGNENGIRQTDIEEGKDTRFYGPHRWERSSGDLRPGILESTRQIPPRSGFLQPDDPFRFGRSDIISFSPKGDSSSGTVYLACRSQQQMFAIVLYGPTARMSLWKFSNSEWQMVGDR